MKSKVMLLSAVILSAWFGLAMAGAEGNVSGEITKIDGEMVTIKMEDGKTKEVHIDAKSTKKEGDLKVGAHVSADVTSGGHANWIKVKEMEEEEKEEEKE